MFYLKKDVNSEIIIKNSRFICYLIKIENDEVISNKLEEIKKIHNKATHYCYAYILEGSKKAYDDGEPTGTAGVPIMNVLEKNNLMNILCIVVRYFGGIKLGAGGLIRAYGKSVRETLINSKLVELQDAIVVELDIEYDELNKIIHLLHNPIIIEKQFSEKIYLKLKTLKKNLKILDNNNFNYKILGNTYIEKED